MGRTKEHISPHSPLRTGVLNAWHRVCARAGQVFERESLTLNKHWYVIYTKAQKEEFAQFNLKLKGIDPLFLRLLLPRFSRSRKRIVPLFPNYLFVRIDLATEYCSVLWSPGVKCFVQFNDVPTPLDDQAVEYLMAQTNNEGIIAARSDLKVGQEVRVSGGAFDGVIGMLLDAPDAKGRVRVLMQLLNREINVELPIHMLAGSWVPHERSVVTSEK